MPATDRIARAPAPQETLRLLEQFRGVLWLDNPCTASPGRCIYLADDVHELFVGRSSRAIIRQLESHYFVETVSIPSIVSPEAFARINAAELLPSDGYICHGSRSQGSGRTVSKGSHQLKGVGRTLHASYHSFYRDMCGALSLMDAAVETFVEKRLRTVLTTPPMPVDFILLPAHDTSAVHILRKGSTEPDVRCVAGRRGSPFRIGHLEYLMSALRTTGEVSVGSYLVHLVLGHAGGVPDTGIETRLLEVFDEIVRRAVRLAAESRVYSLVFSWWPDNFDLFCRVFDVAETEFRFPAVLVDESALPLPEGEETPRAYLRRLEITNGHRRTFCLYPLRNVLSAIYLVAREIRLDTRHLDARYTWPRLCADYEADVALCVGRVLGIDAGDIERSAAVRDALAPLVALFPLVGAPGGPLASQFDWDTFLSELESGSPLTEGVGALVDAKRGAAFRETIRASVVKERIAALGAHLKRTVRDRYFRDGAASVSRTRGLRPFTGG